MPLNIIRNDITRVEADAIVNTANPRVAIGRGTDEAIYNAAGKDRLLAERARIGDMEPGQAAYTPAFDLKAKYIIHTVGPAWMGGGCHERETVASCYRNSLGIADELGCETIAFPLISTGTYGFPKDEALRIAVDEISSFLFTHDMTVYLVVYDRESFVISGRAFADIRSYIEEEEIKQRPELRYESRGQRIRESRPPESRLPFKNGRIGDAGSFDFFEPESGMVEEIGSIPPFGEEYSESVSAPYFEDAYSESYSAPSPGGSFTIDDIIDMQEDTFQQVLFRIIDKKGLTDPEVYKKANIDRKLFSKIRSDVNYTPSKRTVLALIVGLELNMDEAADLLMRAGYSFSPSDLLDITVKVCIERRIYNIHEINCYLFDLGQKTLGA